jgi:hypothetical protein
MMTKMKVKDHLGTEIFVDQDGVFSATVNGRLIERKTARDLEREIEQATKTAVPVFYLDGYWRRRDSEGTSYTIEDIRRDDEAVGLKKRRKAYGGEFKWLSRSKNERPFGSYYIRDGQTDAVLAELCALYDRRQAHDAEEKKIQDAFTAEEQAIRAKLTKLTPEHLTGEAKGQQ